MQDGHKINFGQPCPFTCHDSIQIIVSNSLRNKCSGYSQDFSPLQANFFFLRNEKHFFPFFDTSLGVKNISSHKRNMQWMSKMWI